VTPQELEMLRNKSQILDGMLDDPTFMKWVHDQKEGGDKTEKEPVQGKAVPDDVAKGLEKLKGDNPEVAKLVEDFVSSMSGRMSQLEKAGKDNANRIQKTEWDRFVDSSTSELRRMQADKEKFPLMDAVWPQMQVYLRKREATNPQAAYKMAVGDLVNLNDAALEANPNLLKSSRGGASEADKPVAKKTAREAVEYAFDHVQSKYGRK
jgi:hypothetical protein